MKWLISLSLLVLLTGASKASDLSFFVGWNSPADLKGQAGETFDLKGAAVYGLRYEKDFMMLLGFEHNLTFNGKLLSLEDGPHESGFHYATNFVLNLPVAEEVVPNVALGLGFYRRSGDSFPDAGVGFLTNWGIGVKFRRLAGPAGLRVDLRRIKFRGVERESVVSSEASAGLLFTF
ncbi:MAG TPA: hypothetical protein VMN76_04150 [Acidobacteriota bacterium]|nr:hypothetical protein [Acidobacteriota bacterium]